MRTGPGRRCAGLHQQCLRQSRLRPRRENDFGLYKTECVRHQGPWRGVDDLELGTLSLVDWFNEPAWTAPSVTFRPIDDETEYSRQCTARQQPLLGALALH